MAINRKLGRTTDQRLSILRTLTTDLIWHEKIETTEKYRYITIDDITKELREGKRGVDGIGANGKMTIM